MQVVDVSVMRDFRTTWKDGAMSRSKKQDRIVGSFFFCNVVDGFSGILLGRIKVDQKPTDIFYWRNPTR